MKKEYIKPVILVEEIIVTTMLANSNTEIEGPGNPGDTAVPLSNDRRGGWGDLWN